MGVFYVVFYIVYQLFQGGQYTYKRDLVVITLSLLSFRMIDYLLTLARNAGHINRFVEYQPLGRMFDASGGTFTSDSRIKSPEL